MKYVILLLILFFSHIAQSSLDANTVCSQTDLTVDENECRILVAFYNSSGVEEWDIDRSVDGQPTWGAMNVSSWAGVVVKGRHVTSLILESGGQRSYARPQKPLSGELPTEIAKLTHLEYFSLRGNKLTGSIPVAYKSLTKLVELNLRDNELSGSIPEIFENMKSLEKLSLDTNNFSGVIPSTLANCSYLTTIHLNNNKLTGEIPSLLGDIVQLKDINFSYNLFYGEFPDSLSKLSNLELLTVKSNYLWGDVSNLISKLPNLTGLRLAFNHFWMSDLSVLRDLKGLEVLFLQGNHIAGDINANVYDFNNLTYSLVGDQSIIEMQAYNDPKISLQPGENGTGAVMPTISELGTKIFIVPYEGYAISGLSGCPGQLKANVFTVPGSSLACVLNVAFSPCIGSSCLVDFGNTNSVPNVKVETPSSERLLSGVVQLRGWLNDEEWARDFYWGSKDGRDVYIRIDDGPKLIVKHQQKREDVLTAMGKSPGGSAKNFAWSTVFYSGVLENGMHRVKLYNRAGLLVSEAGFQVFNPLTDGEVKYIKNVNLSLMIDDFPILGHSSRLTFNQAAQSFTVVDQMDSNGKYLSSEYKYFIDDNEERSKFFNVSEVSSIETPEKINIFSGVQSMRGWFRSLYYDGILWQFYNRTLQLDDGGSNKSHLLEGGFEIRQDVNEVFGYNEPERVGWSLLSYSGNLKNGLHRARLTATATDGLGGGGLHIFRDTIFKSFTPLNEFGEQFYVRSYDRDVFVADFPYTGSDVVLRFDSAGQNFTIVSQTIH